MKYSHVNLDFAKKKYSEDFIAKGMTAEQAEKMADFVVCIMQTCFNDFDDAVKKFNEEFDALKAQNEQLEVSMFERICHVCKYRCAKIGDTYKCANGKSFGEKCSKQNCPIIK